MNPGRSLRVLALLFLAVLPTEKKPIRVFLQDGANALDNLHGNWPMANQEMAAAPKFMGYDCKLEFGTECYNAKHGGAILPESVRWLRRDYSK